MTVSSTTGPTDGSRLPCPRKLKIALAVRARRVPLWVAATGDALAAADFIDLRVILVGDAAREPAKPSVGLTDLRSWRLFCLVDGAVRRLLLKGGPDPSAAVDVLQREWAAERRLAPGETVDVVVNVAGPGALPHLSAIAASGVWWFDHDGHVPWGRACSGCLEVLQAQSITTSRLLGRYADGPVTVLRVARTATHPLFASQNRMEMLWKGIPVLLQKLRELHLNGAVCHDDAAGGTLAPDSVKRGRSPRLGSVWLTLHVAQHWRKSMRYVLLRLFKRERWYLVRGVLDSATHDGAETMRFRRDSALYPPDGRSWADPHVLPDSDGEFILVEEYVNSLRRSGRRGRIVLLRIGSSGQVSEARTVLERDWHLSYPCVFRFQDQLLLVPESGAASTVDAYRCLDYPWRWGFLGHVLTGVAAFDSTIFEHEGRWWLFASVADPAWLTPNDMLYAFFADDPSRGPWVPHPMNPVVVDARSARPAGPLFRREGRLYRPGQDCSRGYGSGIRINEVTELTSTRFAERQVDSLEPDWRDDIVATHSLVSSGSAAFVDVMDWVSPRWLTVSRPEQADRHENDSLRRAKRR